MDSELISALVVGWHPGSQDLLLRRIGGILKGLADVSVCQIDEVHNKKASLLVSYAYSERLKQMMDWDSKVKVVGAKLTLLPEGIKKLRSIPRNSSLGIVAEHQRCANYFYSEIIFAGIIDYRFYIGTFNEIEEMPVDRYVVSEEMADLVSKVMVDSDKIVSVPRTVSPISAAEIIKAALEVSGNFD